LFEKPFKMLLDSNKYPLADESFATLAFLSVALLVFSFRRWRESEGEIRSQKYVTDSLRVLHDESDQRVQRRTAELAKSNATLEAEKLERQRIEHALTESERRFSDMMARIELVAMMLDKQGRITYCNDYLLRLTGWQREEVLDKDWFQLFLPPDKGEQLQVVFAALLNDQPAAWHHENEIVTRSGQRRLIRWSNSVLRSPAGDIIGTASIGEDITERQRNERLALRSQRLESIGTLAGGVAHDLNNALAPILMGAEILRTDYPAESQVVNMIQSSARRGADMVRQLLSFAKGAEGERVLLRPPQLVEAIQAMMKGSFPKNIQLNVKCDPKLPMVLGDATQLHQVLLNLCVNARDAMPDGGTLIVEAHSKEVDSAYASNIPEAKPGNYVVLRVRDTGTGIPQEILDRIFEPFFTTKGPEKGTGLGLSTVMGIVKGHGGFLHVYSQPGHGSTFAIYLPANHDCGETELVRKVTVEFRGQGETIMFVDDEAALRETARAVLRRLNFKPLTATDGADGLMQAALHRNELSAIITDLHMPNLDGLSFVKTLRRMLPDIPIVVASGRLEDAVAENFKSLGVTTRLDKPFTEVELADVLKNLLESKKSK
jgi:PAS domain S-box-containing protein